MKRLKLENNLNEEELKKQLKDAKTPAEFKRWQCVYLVHTKKGITAGDLSKILCISTPSVYSYIKSYNTLGASGFLAKSKGGRKRFYLSFAEEEDLLIKINEQILHNEIFSFRKMKKTAEEKIGHSVSDDYMWNLFRRHNWKKKAVVIHRKICTAEREITSKYVKMTWMPPQG